MASNLWLLEDGADTRITSEDLTGPNFDYQRFQKVLLEFLFDREEATREALEGIATPSIFVDGEDDTAQTLFEQLSNNLQIGAKAVNTEVGYALLRFVREIVDQNPRYLLSYLLEMEEFEEGDFNSILDLLGKPGDMMVRFLPGETPHITLYNYRSREEIKIEKKPVEMDLWDLNRVYMMLFGFDPKKYHTEFYE